MTETPLCNLSDIANPGAKEFVVEQAGIKRRVFVVRRGSKVYGYVNSCPHVGAPLNMEPDKFLDMFGDNILCANHFALFEFRTGRCLRGPCLGRRLEVFPVSVLDGVVSWLHGNW